MEDKKTPLYLIRVGKGESSEMLFKSVFEREEALEALS